MPALIEPTEVLRDPCEAAKLERETTQLLHDLAEATIASECPICGFKLQAKFKSTHASTCYVYRAQQLLKRKSLLLLVLLLPLAGCGTISMITRMKHVDSIVQGLELVVADQDAGLERSQICLDDVQDRERAYKVTKLMGWVTDESKAAASLPCIPLVRKP